MKFIVRDGKFDVVIAAGPRVETWPSIGVRTLSILCADLGLTVGQFGGEAINVRGVIPLPGTGGVVLLEDIQKRIHRIRSRAIIRVIPEPMLPNPFQGWYSPLLIPLNTAERLRQESNLTWELPIAILGTGNRALRFGSRLLESGTSEVYCIESHIQWRAKRFAGWEVERRRFEMAGGKLLEAEPFQIVSKTPLLVEFRIKDAHGMRILEVARVISAGPFQSSFGVREYPPGSYLFELEQTALTTLPENVEGWALEEERGKWLAVKIIKALVSELGKKRETLDKILKRSKTRLKRYQNHQEHPFTPSYQGKWLALNDAKTMRNSLGVPKKLHLSRFIASIECFEDIPCHICQTVCPTEAIQSIRISKQNALVLKDEACTACGLCLLECPAGAIPLIHEREESSISSLQLSWRGAQACNTGEFITLLNRKGENLGSARITKVSNLEKNQAGEKVQIIQINAPTYLLWEGRSIRRGRSNPYSAGDPPLSLGKTDFPSFLEEKVEIMLNGEKRLVRDRIPISLALFEMGKNRCVDSLLCKDGSCGLCLVLVDSIKKLACQATIRRGMNIKIPQMNLSLGLASRDNPQQHALCPCLGITQEQVLERLKKGKLHSPDALLSVTRVGEGKCHGQLCMNALKRILITQGLDVSQWIDWRFPWSDWVLPVNN
jgi:Fe-S-cluster-containing hydrogenase component 2